MSLLSILKLPFRMAKLPFSVILMAVGFRHRHGFHLPAAGMDEAKAQTIYFTLKRAATTVEEDQVADDWLTCLELVNVASIRLLEEMDLIETNLGFWTHRLESGRHFWFTLLRQGPLAFARKLWHIVKRKQVNSITDVELVEKRVLIFRLLRGDLSRALAKVQTAASMLYLHDSNELFPEEEDTLFHRARGLIRESLGKVNDAFVTLRTESQSILQAQQTQQVLQVPSLHQDRLLLLQALGKVLRVPHLRRVWTRSQQTLLDEQGEHGDSNATVQSDQSQSGDVFAEIFTAVQQELGYAPRQVRVSSVHETFSRAQRAGKTLSSTQRLLELPHWLPMPSQARQHWLRITVIGCSVGYGMFFIFKHSPLNGSDDLERWCLSGFKAFQGAWKDHIVHPLKRVQGELFDTFRRRPAIVSMSEYEADRDSLQRMLDDFEDDFLKRRKQKASGLTTSAGDVLQGMELMMSTYEEELKKPLRNLISGDLMRSLLIQVQKLKVDTESAMLEIDQILRANELSISLVAAVPAFIIAGILLYGIGRMVTPTPPDPRREALPARMAVIDVERAAEMLHASELKGKVAAKSPELGQVSGEISEEEEEETEARGMFAYRLAAAYAEAEELFRRHQGLFQSGGQTEWTLLSRDLLELAVPGPAALKIQSAARIMRAYTIYQQF